MGHAALENVYEEIGFNQNLIIDAVDVRVRVVVADEPTDPLDKGIVLIAAAAQQCPGGNGALGLLLGAGAGGAAEHPVFTGMARRLAAGDGAVGPAAPLPFLASSPGAAGPASHTHLPSPSQGVR